MRNLLRAAAAVLVGVAAIAAPALAQNDPPGRVARLAFAQGTVSYHAANERDWTRALVNTPLTTGDAIWNEPGARSEISLAGTRVRLDAATQLDMLAIDDQLTRLQLAQGRMDIKTFNWDERVPYEIVTPRGTVTLQQQGDYYIEAGSTQDPTRLGVRAGAAQIQDLNGHVLAVRAGEVGEVFGDASAPQLRTIKAAPPPMPQQWAVRDRQVVYDRPQYVHASMTGYEDLNAHGAWQTDPEYGRVWTPRAVPADWAPYRTGQWVYSPAYGWTWVDEQPWGFAPFHYGRWAERGGRWLWVPPPQDVQPVYAPALVAFLGGLGLGMAISQPVQPVGWFPLGPQEVYFPAYSNNRDYFWRMNRAARIQDSILDQRWAALQRRDTQLDRRDDRLDRRDTQLDRRDAQLDRREDRLDRRAEQLRNQRFATVVSQEDFVRSRPVQRARLNVSQERLAQATVAPVSAPPAREATRDRQQDGTQQRDLTQQRDGTRDRTGPRETETRLGAMPTLDRPANVERPKAPGPQIAARADRRDARPDAQARPGQPADRDAQPPREATREGRDTREPRAGDMPTLRPRVGTAPPRIQGPVTNVTPEQATAPTRDRDQRDQRDRTSPQQAAPAPGAPDRDQTTRPGQPGQQATPAPADRDRDQQRDRPGQQATPAPAPRPPNAATPATPAVPPADRDRTQPPQQRGATPATPATPSPRAQQPAPQPPPQQATPPRRDEPPAPPQARDRDQRGDRTPAPQQPPPRAAAPQPQPPAPPPQQARPQPQPQPQAAPPSPPSQQARPQPQPQPQQQARPQPQPQPQPQQQAQQPQRQQQQPQQQQQSGGGGGGGQKKDKDNN